MKKIALLITLFTIVLAFTVTSVSAQKVTSATKATTEKACCAKDAAKADAKAGCSKEAAKMDCAKTCSKSEAKACGAKGEAKTESMPVPKK